MLSAFVSPLSVKYFGYKKPLVVSSLGMCLGMVRATVYFVLRWETKVLDNKLCWKFLTMKKYICLLICRLRETFPSFSKPKYSLRNITVSTGTVINLNNIWFLTLAPYILVAKKITPSFLILYYSVKASAWYDHSDNFLMLRGNNQI